LSLLKRNSACIIAESDALCNDRVGDYNPAETIARLADRFGETV
jgi:hypothetical protein